jgi:hypothetical protein
VGSWLVLKPRILKRFINGDGLFSSQKRGNFLADVLIFDRNKNFTNSDKKSNPLVLLKD